ncbi:MAG TPA: glutamine-hydrolyzing carbamoyl-phosphate synthase small subunit [Flavobacteriaceae bacterium]|nr:glutamine-hydrolyzing carbamoyl-phosphate synthase small subunit [Flavobacteriaceae bacterium]
MKFQTPVKAIILLADGTVFYGNAIGKSQKSVIGEVCFTTAMTGYEDLFLDPSYSNKIVVHAPSHIGGYGINEEEIYSENAKISGLIARNFGKFYSRTKADGSLQEYLERDRVFILSDVDTRALVTHLRENGSMRGILSTETENLEQLKSQLKSFQEPSTEELLRRNSTLEAYTSGVSAEPKYKVAVLDLGLKKSYLQFLEARDCEMMIFPYSASFEEMMDFQPDGFFVAGGPGNPMEMSHQLNVVKKILNSGKPFFGVGIGHNLLALAMGVPSVKMNIGHQGANHSVKNILTGKGEITVQNHDYQINKTQLETHPDLELTHIDLNDQSVEGVRVKGKKVFSVQYAPGGKPGPTDSEYLWDEFVQMLKN